MDSQDILILFSHTDTLTIHPPPPTHTGKTEEENRAIIGMGKKGSTVQSNGLKFSHNRTQRELSKHLHARD